MSGAKAPLHLAGPGDTDRLLPLVAACHAELGLGTDEDHRLRAVAPLLEGSSLGAIWLIGPRRSPVGYIALGFRWSITAGGIEAALDDIFLRPAVRRRGLGGEAVAALCKIMRDAGIRAMSADLPDRTPLAPFLERHGFARLDSASRLRRTFAGRT